MTTCDVALDGCAPTPLANYLKALGILRLVAEQADADARGWWQGARFVLRSRLDRAALEGFFLHDYAPTPIIAPWNGGSGFYYREGKSKEKDPTTGKRLKTGIRDEPTEATRAIDKIKLSSACRLFAYRESINIAASTLETLCISKAPTGDENKKRIILNLLRAILPENCLVWLDSCLIGAGDAADKGLAYPPLLGSGGNDGNLDFSSNFIQRLIELFDLQSGSPLEQCKPLLHNALSVDSVPALVRAAIGHFGSGAAGGVNGTAGFEADGWINPWDFILMLEGALAFAAAATRRNESADRGSLSYPFTVRLTGAGSGQTALSDEGPEGYELWMPLWTRPARYDEIRALFSEARVTLGRRPARDGLDFVRAVSGLGVDRGIASFLRYGLMKRRGDNRLASALSAVRVARNARADLIDQLDEGGWLEAFRRFARGNEAPARLRGIARRLDEALFQMAAPRGGGDGGQRPSAAVQAALIALGEALSYLAHSPKGRDAVRRLPRLREDWVAEADDGSDAFRLAAAIASIRNEDGMSVWPMLGHLAPVDETGRKWDETARQRVVWGQGSLVDNLCAVLRRRLIDAERTGLADKPLAARCGADCVAIAAFLAEATLDRRIDALVRGLVVADVPRVLPIRPRPETVPETAPVPVVYALIKPLFTPDAVLRKDLRLLAQDATLPIPRALIGIVMGNRVTKGIEIARRRARASGLAPLFTGADAVSLDGRRLAASLLIPLATGALGGLITMAYGKTEVLQSSVLGPSSNEHARGIAP